MQVVIIVIVLILILIMFCMKPCSRENYRDPIYLNRAKLAYDWYPRSNGSIYGFPVPCGSWHLLRGFPFYNAY